MEWNWCWSGNNSTPYSLYESSGDSEDIRSDNHHENEVTIDENEGESLRFHDDFVVVDDDDNDNDDAQSCSYDHSSYINTTSCSNSQHDQSQRLNDDVDVHYYDEDEDEDEDDKDWGESKLMNPSKKQKRSHNFCVDSLNQREIDRKFWETCLAT